mmetsp:Transcript_39213/g.62077  ORF Transcript_39213/g.62077 Transcript_39213/m.62077 type:complete len:258 (+) Transcript_39213:39-812(+)|eukprot:CAMPEP_0169125702 /NCGR_PEP_ID=MMETSP1015-20121227/35036_1 /TAXON_ID=342587 /ORGANISM="Karlodinium micrum, Strain CCMP2283" /LENGTH=257 /DNA_ID=CAMNT_0009189277 /DNA_START=39 /DNA_END=812 /DNA_ORIENTATION=+
MSQPSGGHTPGHPDLWRKGSPAGSQQGLQHSSSVPTLRRSSSNTSTQNVQSMSSSALPAAGRPSSFAPTATRNLHLELTRRPKLMSVGGTGGFHFWSEDDGGLERHEAAEEIKLENTRKLLAQGQEHGSKMLHHNPPTGMLEGIDKRFKTYSINGKVYGSGKRNAPPPEQTSKCHWLCQVNGMTGRYNIVNGRYEDPNVTRQRDTELAKLRSMKEADAMAGDVQPTRPIACYEMRNFVPLRHHHHLGVAERHNSLFS